MRENAPLPCQIDQMLGQSFHNKNVSLMWKYYPESFMVKYGCFYLYGTPRGSPGDSQKNDGPVPDPYRNKVVPYRSRTVRDSYGIPRDPLQTPLFIMYKAPLTYSDRKSRKNRSSAVDLGPTSGTVLGSSRILFATEIYHRIFAPVNLKVWNKM